VATEMLQGLDGLLDRGTMARTDPLQYRERLIQPLEPLPPVSHDLGVLSAIDERVQGFRRLPNGEVDEHAFVIEGPKGRGVPVLRLEAPDEAGCPIGQGIDLFETGDEPGQLRRVQGRDDASDIQLSKLVVRHGLNIARDQALPPNGSRSGTSSPTARDAYAHKQADAGNRTGQNGCYGGVQIGHGNRRGDRKSDHPTNERTTRRFP